MYAAPPEGERAAPFDTAAVLAVKAPVNHLLPGRTDRDAITINDTIDKLPVALVGYVKYDDRVDVPSVKELVCSVIVAGRVRNERVER